MTTKLFHILMKKTDVILLTENAYENPTVIDKYIQNVLTEDGLVKKALEEFLLGPYLVALLMLQPLSLPKNLI